MLLTLDILRELTRNEEVRLLGLVGDKVRANQDKSIRIIKDITQLLSHNLFLVNGIQDSHFELEELTFSDIGSIIEVSYELNPARCTNHLMVILKAMDNALENLSREDLITLHSAIGPSLKTLITTSVHGVVIKWASEILVGLEEAASSGLIGMTPEELAGFPCVTYADLWYTAVWLELAVEREGNNLGSVRLEALQESITKALENQVEEWADSEPDLINLLFLMDAWDTKCLIVTGYDVVNTVRRNREG